MKGIKMNHSYGKREQKTVCSGINLKRMSVKRVIKRLKIEKVPGGEWNKCIDHSVMFVVGIIVDWIRTMVSHYVKEGDGRMNVAIVKVYRVCKLNYNSVEKSKTTIFGKGKNGVVNFVVSIE